MPLGNISSFKLFRSINWLTKPTEVQPDRFSVDKLGRLASGFSSPILYLELIDRVVKWDRLASDARSTEDKDSPVLIDRVVKLGRLANGLRSLSVETDTFNTVRPVRFIK